MKAVNQVSSSTYFISSLRLNSNWNMVLRRNGEEIGEAIQFSLAQAGDGLERNIVHEVGSCQDLGRIPTRTPR